MLKTQARRKAMIEEVITDKALGYRFDEHGHPHTTDDLKESAQRAIDLWNSTADEINRWYGKEWVGLRLRWGSDALSLEFRPTADAELPDAYWHAVVKLDRLAEHAMGPTRLTVPIERIHWMADFVLMSLLSPEFIDRAAHSKDGIWDRRLRHTVRAKGRRRQAFMNEAALVIEGERQEAEFVAMLRDTVRKHRKLQAEAASDRDVDIGPAQVRVIQLQDHKGLMLMPPLRGGRRVLPKKPAE